MARGKGRSGRRYVRDAKGRFASKGFSGQTGGRGARLKSGKGNTRQGGGEKVKVSGAKSSGIIRRSTIKAARPSGTISKPKASTARKPTAKTTKSPANKAKTAYKAARADARMRNQDLRGADVKERRMANTAAAKLKNMERRRSASVPKADADSPKSRQTARATARMQRAYTNKRQAYGRWERNEATNKDSRKASVAKQAMRIYRGEVNPKVKSRARLTRTQNPDVLRDRIKRGEKLTAAKARKAAKRRRR